MTGEYDHEGWPRIIQLAWMRPPINAHRVLAFGLDGSNAVAIKVASDGTVATSGSGGGGDGAILDGVSSSIKATVFDYANSNPLSTILVDTNGDPASVGGGTQHAEDSAHSSGAVGNLILGVRNNSIATTFTDANGDYSPIAVLGTGQVVGASERPHNTATSAGDFGTQTMGVRNDDAGTTLASADLNHSEWSVDLKGRQFVTGSTGMVALKVDGSAVTQPISGIVTANAGLGTFSVAGIVTANAGLGTFTVAGSVTANAGIGFAWDESNRAKVNPIAGQAGVAAGAGDVSALTQRVVPAITEAIHSTFTVQGISSSSTYATALATATWRWIKYVNKTDQDFAVSYNASTEHNVVVAGSSEVVDLYANGMKISTAVSYKYLSLPTKGKFYAVGMST